MYSERPTTTGESASGRSTNAFTRPFPGNRRRTIASAQTIPKIVFNGTAIAVMISVFFSAPVVCESVSAFQTAPKPWSNVFQKSIESGPSRTTSR